MLSFKPSILIDYQQFANLLLGNLKNLQEEILEISNLVRTASNYKYSNNILRISSSYGTEFYVLLLDHNINFWDMHDFIVAKEILPERLEERKKVIHSIERKIFRYDQGFINCSKCGEEIELHLHTSNRFYAGIYCDDCWDNGIRQQEAKENYN